MQITIFAGEIFTDALELLKPVFLENAETSAKKKVILATVEGDYHDIGKNIVRSVLISKGLEVIDLGVDAAPAKIVETAKVENADVIALSVVLTFSINAMQKTIEICEKEGIRNRIRIVIGGSSANETIAMKIGADRYCQTPEETAKFCLTEG